MSLLSWTCWLHGVAQIWNIFFRQTLWYADCRLNKGVTQYFALCVCFDYKPWTARKSTCLLIFFFFLPRMLYAACMEQNKTADSLCLQAANKHTHCPAVAHCHKSGNTSLIKTVILKSTSTNKTKYNTTFNGRALQSLSRIGIPYNTTT